MSFLNKIEDWIIRQTLQPPLETSPMLPSPKDDVPIALTLFVLFSLVIVATCGHYFAH
jgi:hypothetical protein